MTSPLQRSEIEFEENDAVKWMCRHLVVLVATCHALDSDGKVTGDEQMLIFPGFVVEFMGEWCWVTAGHNFIDILEQHVEKGKIRINKYAFMDYFGPDARVKQQIYFWLPDEPRWRVERPELGIDFAVLHLRHLFVENFKASGIVPFTEANWLPTDRLDFEFHAMLGTPSELTDYISAPFGDRTKFGTAIRVVFIGVYKTDDVPDDSESPPENWFRARVSTPFSVKGMSGSPIFGFNKNNDGLWEYRVVAVQSRWYPKQAFIYATPISPVLQVLKAGFQELMEQEQAQANEEA